MPPPVVVARRITVILNTFKKDPDSEKLSYDLHFWIGEESTQDEYGVAAYKTVELDDLLTGTMGSSPVQHRQCMGHESELFLSYFPDGLIIKEGGIESGFRHVEPSEYQPRLLQIQRRGGQSRAFEVDCKIDALDTSDCFILDSGSKIYVYHGPTSDPFEKNKSTSLAETMEAERGDGSERVDVDDDFWSILGGTEADASAVSEDSTVWQPPEWTEPVLYSMEDNTLEWVEVKKGAIEPTDIKNDDVMLLDCSVELFVCVGNDAPEGEKTSCMVKAQEFLKSSGKPIYVPITRVNEGCALPCPAPCPALPCAVPCPALRISECCLSVDRWCVAGKTQTRTALASALRRRARALPRRHSRANRASLPPLPRLPPAAAVARLSHLRRRAWTD